MSSLTAIIDQIAARRRDTTITYQIPGLWVDKVSTAPVPVNPYDFYHKRLSDIATTEPQGLVHASSNGGGGDWSANAVVYNLFPRVTTAFDHSADGHLQIGPTADGWRETGTLLKCIALLPYIRNMGFNTVHLLPITAIGQDGKKGTLGSPYAIRNPYQLDGNLDEPALGLTPDQLFGGYVEAAHLLGLRVIMEFVLRTASKDGDWIKEHPILGNNYSWPGNFRELEQCVRNFLIRKRYTPLSVEAHENKGAALAAAVQHGSLTLSELERRYCTLVYSQLGTYKATAERLGIDRRTLKDKIAGSANQ